MGRAQPIAQPALGDRLSSSWDLEIAARYGAVAAVEARRKDVDVVLGPTINLHRSPLGGRHFEAFSEDPLLTGDLAAAYVRGVQQQRCGRHPQALRRQRLRDRALHRRRRVDERALREVYLLPFEKAIVESTRLAGDERLQLDQWHHRHRERPAGIARSTREWGFDGVVISDWTAVRSLDSADTAQDLVMPGPDGPVGRRPRRRGPRRVRSTSPASTARCCGSCCWPPGSARSRASARGREAAPPSRTVLPSPATAAAEGSVLLRNEGRAALEPPTASAESPSSATTPTQARTQGGGSATAVPESGRHRHCDGIRAAFADAEVTYSLGAIVQEGLAEFPLGTMTNPVTGGPAPACASWTPPERSCSPNTGSPPHCSTSGATPRRRRPRPSSSPPD